MCHEQAAGTYCIGKKAAHEHEHEYDSTDILDVGGAVHAARTYVMKHATDIHFIGMEAIL